MAEDTGLEHGKQSPKKEVLYFGNEITGLKSNVEKNAEENAMIIDELVSNTPEWISQEFCRTKIVKINLEDVGVINLINQIPKEKRSIVLQKAAVLKDRFGGKLGDKESIQYTILGKSESDILLESYKSEYDLDTYNIMSIMYDAIDEGKDPSKEEIRIPTNILISDENITINFKDNERFLRFDMLPKDIQNKLLLGIEGKYRNALDEAIDNFGLENPRIPITASFYNENIFNLYTRYYNIQQWIDEDTVLDDEFLSDKDKQVLQTKFNATLKLLGKRVEDGDIDTSYLRKQEGRDGRIREENQKRLEEWKRRNREMNNKKNKIRKGKIPSPEKAEDLGKTIDMQSASGVDIAKQVGLGKQLNEKYGNKNSQEDLQPDDQLYLSNRAFSIARSRFIQSHSGLKSVVTDEIVLSLYNQDKNSIKTLDDKARDPLKKIFQDSPEELTKLYNQLLNFPNEVNSVKEKLQRGSRFVKIIKDENKNNYAAGVIIDNIRGIFSENQENKGEKINSRLRLNSVKIEGDDLVMLGKYDEVNMMVQYNLKTGEIFMNSFFQYSNDQSKITLGDNLSIRQSVGYLAPFDNILTDNNLLISQVNLLSNIVVDKSKKQSATNSIIVKFMKTFNIVPTQGEFENLEFNSGSNLFDVIQIIEKTGDPKTGNIQSLEYFNNTFMPTIMKYSCLKRGENNLLGPQKNEVDGDVYDITFNESNKSQYISSIRDSANNFSQNLQKFKHEKIKNYDSDYQLGFADFIKNNFVEGNKPDWKLNFSKMSDFIGHLEADGKES